MSPGPKAGDLVGNSLRLIRKLGEGGMGSVWTAEHLGLGVNVAVKFLSPALASDETANARFSREANASAQIKHPHAVQVLDHGVSEEGWPYIAMELLEGENLDCRVRREGGLPLGETVRIISQVARALAKAHAMGIVHRDVKPDNIFLSDVDGETYARVLDFGIAKHAGGADKSVTSTGTLVGTPYYMSPEQAFSSKDVDHTADVWSLAVVTYFCLAARVPFDGETMAALHVAIDKGVFEPIRHRRGDLPEAMDAFFVRALCREPNGRYPSVRDLSAALQAASQGQVTYSLPSGDRSVPGDRVVIAASPSPSAATLSGATVRQDGLPGGRVGAGRLRLLVAGVLALVAAGAAITFALRRSDVALPAGSTPGLVASAPADIASAAASQSASSAVSSPLPTAVGGDASAVRAESDAGRLRSTQPVVLPSGPGPTKRNPPSQEENFGF